MVDDPLAGQPRDEVRPGQQVARRGPGHGRLLVADPGDLRGAVVGVEVETRDRPDRVRVDAPTDRVGLSSGAPVHPDDRRSEWTRVGIDRDDAIDLAGEADRTDVRWVDLRVVAERPDDVGQGPFPVGRVLLGPDVAGMTDRICGRRGRLDRPGRPDQHALEALGPHIAPDRVDGPSSAGHQSSDDS